MKYTKTIYTVSSALTAVIGVVGGMYASGRGEKSSGDYAIIAAAAMGAGILGYFTGKRIEEKHQALEKAISPHESKISEEIQVRTVYIPPVATVAELAESLDETVESFIEKIGNKVDFPIKATTIMPYNTLAWVISLVYPEAVVKPISEYHAEMSKQEMTQDNINGVVSEEAPPTVIELPQSQDNKS